MSRYRQRDANAEIARQRAEEMRQMKQIAIIDAAGGAIRGVTNTVGQIAQDPGKTAMRTGFGLMMVGTVFPPAMAVGVPLMILGTGAKAVEDTVERNI